MNRREFAKKVESYLASGPPEETHNEQYWFISLSEWANREFNYLCNQEKKSLYDGKTDTELAS